MPTRCSTKKSTSEIIRFSRLGARVRFKARVPSPGSRALEILMKPFLDAIDDRILVCDGAMGTMLYAKGVFINRCFDALNLTQPDTVSEVHQDYLRAGADIVETNTFGANRVKLRAFGLGDKVADINREGARLARRAVRDHAYVAGAVGPL